jgi:hypothetical protein
MKNDKVNYVLFAFSVSLILIFITFSFMELMQR